MFLLWGECCRPIKNVRVYRWISIIFVNSKLKGYSEIRWSRVHFSDLHILILLHIQKKQDMQEQSRFGKIGTSCIFEFLMPRHQKLQHSIQWRSVIHGISQCKIKANWNFEHKLLKWISINGCHRKRVLEFSQISLNIALRWQVSEYCYKASLWILL